MYFRELGLIREMQCRILQQISSVNYEELARSVHLSAVESKGTCVHVCTHGVHLHGQLLVPFPYVFSHSSVAAERAGWPKTGRFPAEAGDINAV